MKQQSLFTWLQRSPENQQRKPFSNETSVQPVSPVVKPLPSEKTAEKKAMKCANNVPTSPVLATLKSPTAKKASKLKENKEKKPSAKPVLPSSPFAVKSQSVSEKKADAPSTTTTLSVKNIAPVEDKGKKVDAAEHEAMSVDSPVNISSDSEDVVETAPPTNNPASITENKAFSSDNDEEVKEVKHDVCSVMSLWNKSVKPQAAKVSSGNAGTSTEASAPVAPTVVRVPMPPVREIKCSEDFDPQRIPDVLVVTEFLRSFGCLILKRGSRHLDPEPDFHVLLDALGRSADQDPLYLCGIIFHLVSFVSKQPAFLKMKHLGQPLSQFDLSVQSSPEILRIFLTNLPAKSLVPSLSDEVAGKWLEKGFFSLPPAERLDVLLLTVNWLISTPLIIDYMTKKEDIMHKLRSNLLRLRRQQIKEKASLKAAQSVENNECIDDMLNENISDEEKEKPIRGAAASSKSQSSVNAASLNQLATEISELKVSVDKAEREFNQVRCHLPVGVDRDGSTYWQFPTFSLNSADKAVVVENKENHWGYYSPDDLFIVISSMQSNPFAADFTLRMALEGVVKEAQAIQQSEPSQDPFLEEDVDFSAGILDELAENLLDSEARIYAAAFADPMPNLDDWRGRVKSPVPGERAKTLAQCLLALANSVYLRVVVPSAKVSPQTLEKKKDEEEDEKEEKKKKTNDEPPIDVQFFASDSYFAQWKTEVGKTENSSRLLVLLDIFLTWLNWSMSAEHARCRRCRRGPNSGLLILCDKCNRSYHFKCLDPPLKEAPDGDWFCPECTKREAKLADMDGSDVEALDNNDDGTDYELEESDEEVEEFREPDIECRECRGPATDSDELISCSICFNSFHLDCLDPPLRYPPRGTWYCAKCVKSKNKRKTRRRVLCESPPSPKPKARAVKKAANSVSKRVTRASRDVPSRTSSRSQTFSRTSNRSPSPPVQMAELCERYSFRPRANRRM